MRLVSNEFRNQMQKRRNWNYSITLNLVNGETYNITDDMLINETNVISQTCGTSQFPLGNCIGKSITLTLNNADEQWASSNFAGATINSKLNFKVNPSYTEELFLGNFTVVYPENYGTTIQLTALDNTYKTDVDYTSDIIYPATLLQIWLDALDTVGIVPGTRTFTNQDFVVNEKPENVSVRQLLGLIGMLAGGNVLMDDNGKAIIVNYDMSALPETIDGGVFDTSKPYSSGVSLDGGTFSNYASGSTADGGSFTDARYYHILSNGNNPVIETDDVIPTGVQTTVDQVTYTAGIDGYVVSISNELIKGKEQEGVNTIWSAIQGVCFRPFSIDLVSDPTIEFGDCAFIVDRKGRLYKTLITDVEFNLRGSTAVKCSAEGPLRNSASYQNAANKVLQKVNNLVDEEKTAREEAVENLQEQITNSGGLYQTRTTTLPGLPTIVNKPNLKITFSSECVLEKNYDYISLYVYDETTKKYLAIVEKEYEPASKELIFPANNVQLYFKSDASNTKWGWKIDTFERTDKAVNVTLSEPKYYSDIEGATIRYTNLYESSHPYDNNMKIMSEYPLTNAEYFVLHEKPNLEDSSIWWVASAHAMYVSTDGGKTYNAAVTADGEAMLKYLATEGIDAEWIRTGYLSADRMRGGTLELGGTSYGANGSIKTYDTNNKLIASLDKLGLSIRSGSMYLTKETTLNRSGTQMENNGVFLYNYTKSSGSGSYVNINTGSNSMDTNVTFGEDTFDYDDTTGKVSRKVTNTKQCKLKVEHFSDLSDTNYKLGLSLQAPFVGIEADAVAFFGNCAGYTGRIYTGTKVLNVEYGRIMSVENG